MTKCKLMNAQTFWARVILQNQNFWIGQVESKLLDERLDVGDLIKFHPTNIFDVAYNVESDP